MSTRGLYQFTDGEQTINVYKHWDNYPEGAWGFIAAALPYAWELPRFEADDFAAAFVAANKKQGGGDIRLLNDASTNGDVLGIQYIYKIRKASGQNAIVVDCFDTYTGSKVETRYFEAIKESEAV